MIYLLIGYMWLFVHKPFEIYQWMANIHLERLYVAACVLYWLVFHTDKRWVGNRISLAFGFLWVAMTLAYLASPYQDTDRCIATYQNYLKVLVFYPLVMTTVRDEKQLKLLTGGYIAGFALYMTHSLREFRNGRYVFRMGIVRMIGVDESGSDPNSFASSILYALAISLAFWPEVKSRRERFFLSYYTVLSVVCVILTGSRSGLVGLLSVLTFSFRRLFRKKLLLLLVLVAIPMVWQVMDERLQTRFWTLIDSSAGPESARESAEGRIKGLYDGISLWERSPVLGFGPGANGLAMGHGFEAHNLYGQVLGETGTLGALGLLSVVFCFLLNGWEARCLRLRMVGDLGRFPTNLAGSVVLAVTILLIKGNSDHNLFRYNWVWFAAFQASALYCLRRSYEETLGVYHMGNPSASYGLEPDRAASEDQPI